ncbi:hypothetical protein BEP19_11775 [Ammoniphilus oxalaticus]|uniref:YtkA-like domain-containing protein n=1 Tax=Ammoniphilus oxalaticus TaxID=66863 RepID=A0A419SGK4_9BACL|nr:FixH family protein [Ammoniphilus oxalaticus]RKD22908.1 hypothetical protein BEP19_11775 [Ammoniphilus oxalaticus]
MRGFRFLFVVLSALFILSACSSKDNGQVIDEEEVLDTLEAELIIPSELAVNEEILLSVKVTYGAEIVEDADEVQFETWRINQKEDSSELTDAFYDEDGIYSIHKAFTEDGVYYVQPHVTARGLHTMPVQPIIVGNPSDEELQQLEQKNNPEHSELDDQGEHGDH